MSVHSEYDADPAGRAVLASGLDLRIAHQNVQGGLQLLIPGREVGKVGGGRSSKGEQQGWSRDRQKATG